MIDKILIIMPTRARPWAALEAVASIKSTAHHPDNVQICLCQDDDDPTGVIDVGHRGRRGIRTLVGPRKRFVAWVNYALHHCGMIDYSHVAWGSDDVRFRTTGWDDMVKARPELVVYGRDGVRDACTHPFIRIDIPLTLGYLLPSELVHQFPDNFIADIGRAVPSIHFEEAIITEHLHYTVNKAPRDESYAESEKAFPTDKHTYQALIAPKIPSIAERIRQELGQRLSK